LADKASELAHEAGSMHSEGAIKTPQEGVIDTLERSLNDIPTCLPTRCMGSAAAWDGSYVSRAKLVDLLHRSYTRLVRTNQRAPLTRLLPPVSALTGLGNCLSSARFTPPPFGK
jgi:hypothetical protein